MQWNSVGELLAMGGYARYVWGSFGLTAFVMLCEVLILRSQRKTTLRQLRNELQSEGSSS
jgi:heme exporter protein D